MYAMAKRSLNRFTPTSNLFVVPNFFREVSRIVDLWGFLDEYRYSRSEARADHESLKRDYQIVLQNMERVLAEYERKERARARNTRKSA